MSDIPRFLEHALSRELPKYKAKEVFEWTQSNSVWVIVDELLIAIRKRRDWTKKDEDD